MILAGDITSCYIGPEISPEQFIQEHFFLYLAKGLMHGYDGNKYYTLRPGNYCIVRKNHLARYNKEKEDGEFKKVVVIFDEMFLKNFLANHKVDVLIYQSKSSFLSFKKNESIPAFVQSLMPHYTGFGTLDEKIADAKRTELLLKLLHIKPQLAGILFDFGIPGKIDLEAFMNKNYKFNVNMNRLAYLTGRSLSAFKRDFEKIFNDTPSRWLVHRRLDEAYFLINKKRKRPSEIYIDLGFEDLSHFSFAFKKKFGINAGELAPKNNISLNPVS